jgi:ferredoxin
VITVIFDSSGSPLLEVSAPDGARLIDLCDERCAPVPFSCRSASCGTCRVEVLQGADLLDPPGEEELVVLRVFGHVPGAYRLACQAKFRTVAGPGAEALVLRIRAAQDD